MTVSNKAVFPQSITMGTAVCTAAKTTYNDAANAVLLLTMGADGGEVTEVRATPRATCTATQLQLYVSTDGGATLLLFETAQMPALTMSAAVPAASTRFTASDLAPWRLPANARLYAAIGVALVHGVVFVAQARNL